MKKFRSLRTFIYGFLWMLYVTPVNGYANTGSYHTLLSNLLYHSFAIKVQVNYLKIILEVWLKANNCLSSDFNIASMERKVLVGTLSNRVFIENLA